MKAETKLARVFIAIAEHEGQMDNTAAQVLSICKDAKAYTIEKFDQMVAAAYEANGWNVRGGRPTNGNEATPVPTTVRTYVTVIRRAIRAKLRVGTYDTFSALRTALREKGAKGRSRAAPTPTIGVPIADPDTLDKDVRQAFKHVTVALASKPIGSLFHDLAWIYTRLGADQRQTFGGQLEQRLSHWTMVATAAAATKTAAVGNNKNGQKAATA